MTTFDIITLICTIALVICCICYMISMRLEIKYHEMLVSAVFRYRTQCYITGIEPGFDIDIIGRLPWWSLHWKHMIPKEYYYLVKSYMDDLKDDDRFN